MGFIMCIEVQHCGSNISSSSVCDVLPVVLVVFINNYSTNNYYDVVVTGKFNRHQRI